MKLEVEYIRVRTIDSFNIRNLTIEKNLFRKNNLHLTRVKKFFLIEINFLSNETIS